MKKKYMIFFTIVLIAVSVIYSYNDIMFVFNLNRAEYYSNSQKYDEALKIYDKLIKDNKDIYELYFNKAIILSEMNEKQKAIDLLEGIIEMNDKDEELYYNLSILYNDIDKEKSTLYFNKYEELLGDK